METRLTIPDNAITHLWECEDCDQGEYISEVYPDFYQEAGTPICENCGDDMTYVHTLLNPHVITIGSI